MLKNPYASSILFKFGQITNNLMILRRFHEGGAVAVPAAQKYLYRKGAQRFMCRYVLAVILFVVVGLPAIASVNIPEVENDIDVVWSTSDGIKMEIYYSQRQNGNWLEPVRVTDDHYDNMYPVIDRDADGKRWIFWTAYANGKMEIRYTSGDGEEWDTSELLFSEKKTNLSPSVVIDDQDRVWVTWSANNDDLDDIMYASFESGSWSNSDTVHEPNEAPDLLPLIEIGGDGTPQIKWRANREGHNLVLTSKWVDGDWSEPEIEEIKGEDEKDAEERIIELPRFVNKSSMVFVRAY